MRKRCKRKVWVKVDPIQHAIEGARVSDDKLLNELRVRDLAAIKHSALVQQDCRSGPT